MIRFVEITPPSEAIFRQAKILSIEVAEGADVKAGQAIFIVESAGKKHPLPAPNDGRIVEFIVDSGDSIHANSTLLLLEMEVADDVSKIPEDKAQPSEPSSEVEKTAEQKTEQQTATTSKQNKAVRKKSSKKRNSRKKNQATGDADKQQQLSLDDLGLATDNHEPITSISKIEEPHTHEEKRIDMSEITVPDLGGADAVEVIDILVNVGDTVNADDALMTVESDKASMDIPAPSSGKIEAILVSTGDSVAEGDVIFKLAGSDTGNDSNDTATSTTPDQTATAATEAPASASEISIIVPDLGGANDVEVIDLLVAVGDAVTADQPVITVESDKASMDVPTTNAGVIKAINVAVGDTVNEGDAILVITAEGGSASAAKPAASNTSADTAKPAQAKTTTQPAPAQTSNSAVSQSPAQQGAPNTSGDFHASPSIRRFARELGVDLSKVTGTERKNRISQDDVKQFVKGVMSGNNRSANNTATNGAGIPEVPAQDFSKFGDIEITPLNKIKRVTAAHLHRSWLNVPHVTHSDESNVANLEEFRKTLNAEYAKRKQDIKLSPLAFIVKAVVNALQTYPQFNSSLENGGENLILKNYYHIGIAVETPNGLVVPVIRNADQLSVAEIAQAMGELAKKARDGKLTANDMSGGTFTISSLGGIGGTHFTPIVNAPEVAILGVSRTKTQPVWNGNEFIPAPILPLSLSYDHRVIDGAEAARFTRHIAAVLEDLRRLAL